MKYKDILSGIIDMKDNDLAFCDSLIESGQLSEGCHEGMVRLHNKDAQRLNEIMI